MYLVSISGYSESPHVYQRLCCVNVCCTVGTQVAAMSVLHVIVQMTVVVCMPFTLAIIT